MPRGKIHFRFALLDLGDSDCQVNYLRLYNGIGSKKTEIGERKKILTGFLKQTFNHQVLGLEGDF